MEAKIDRVIPEKGKLGTKARPVQAFGPSNLDLGEKLSLSFPALHSHPASVLHASRAG